MTSPQNPHHARRAPSGFTLVELLVVIGIIALLISILLPSLSKARESANTVKCLANLKSIGQAANIYATENHGCVLPAAYLDLPYNSGFITDNYATILIASNILTAPKLGSVTAAPSSATSVFFCPNGLTDTVSVYYSKAGTAKPNPPTRKDGLGARPWRAMSSLDNTIIVDTWYGYNANWGVGVSTNPVPGQVQPDFTNAAPTVPIWAYRKLSAIKYAAEMVMLFDGTFYDLNFDANRMNARHNRQTQTNLLFFDGHAQTYNTKDLPGGDLNANAVGGQGNTVFTSATLLAPWATPKWRLDQ